MRKVKKSVEMGHMTNLGEEWRDCLVRGPKEGEWSEQCWKGKLSKDEVRRKAPCFFAKKSSFWCGFKDYQV